jgi:ribosomal protein L11 methyltransferase
VSDKSWFAIEIVVDPRAADAVEHCLNELDALGTEIDQLRKKNDADMTIVGYFENPSDEAEIREQLNSLLDAFDLDDSLIRSISHREVENTDWLAEWKKHWRPTRVGRFVIAPNWCEIDEEPGTILIRIEPNMAFGTGTHETTKLCLKAIDEAYHPGMSFLDVGTGTGILAIAIAKMNGRSLDEKITGIELDPGSVTIARENVVTNNVGDRITILEGTLADDAPPHDFVCANVTLDVISPMLPLLLNKSRKQLVLSGILTEQESQIVQELKTLGIDDPTIERDGEWIAVRIER